MKIWTFLEAKTKIQKDLGIEDETFISYDELSGKFNDALTEAESEIMLTNGEYLLTSGFLPLVIGAERYALPDNIFANKIRGIMYANGSVIYPIKQYRRRQKFENQLYTEEYGSADPYRYTLMNDYPGQALLQLRPAAREAAIFPPQSGSFVPIQLWYYRNCARVPMVGEYCNPELLASTQFNISTNVITINTATSTIGIPAQGQVGCYPGSIAFVTGDQVKFKAGPMGTLPSGIAAGTVYFVIVVTSATIKLATTLINAQAGTAISLTSQGAVSSIMTVAATHAIIEATLLDIPEFTPYILSHVKVAVSSKEKSPTYGNDVAERDRMKDNMVANLTQAIPDDDDFIQPDFTSYQEMS